MQIVLTLCNEYLLNATSTYSMQQVLTQYNSCMLYAMVLTLGNEYLLYATSTYSKLQVLTLCNSYLLWSTLYKGYLLDTTSTYAL